MDFSGREEKNPKKPIGFFKKKTTWFKPWFKPRLKPLGLNRANPAPYPSHCTQLLKSSEIVTN